MTVHFGRSSGGVARFGVLFISIGVAVIAMFSPTAHRADAVIEQIYTLPFYQSASIPTEGCFHCY
jgi:hypothetical protein